MLQLGLAGLLGFIAGVAFILTLQRKRRNSMAFDLPSILDKVRSLTTVAESQEALLTRIAAALRTAVQQNDQTTLKAISDELDKNIGEITAATVANTDVDPGGQPTQPTTPPPADTPPPVEQPAQT